MAKKGNCYLCGEYGLIDIHHVDWHHDNNNSENRISLCKRCHTEFHRIGFIDKMEIDKIREKVWAKQPNKQTLLI